MAMIRLANLLVAPEAHRLSDEGVGPGLRRAVIHVEGMACEAI
jgi:hypothetical protein